MSNDGDLPPSSRALFQMLVKSITPLSGQLGLGTAELKVRAREVSEVTESVKDTLPTQPPVSAGVLVESTQVVHWG
jgi:hypothetical protein